MNNVCTHFIGFKGEEFYNAVKIFGYPDFIHRQHDGRCVSMIEEQDIAIFANGSEVRSNSVYSFDDSSVM